MQRVGCTAARLVRLHHPVFDGVLLPVKICGIARVHARLFHRRFDNLVCECARCNQSDPVVRQCFHVVAVLLKRSFLSASSTTDPSRGSPSAIMHWFQLLASLPQPQAMLAVSFGRAVIAEFSCTHASRIGQPWSFHVECHRGFESRCAQRHADRSGSCALSHVTI